MIDKTPFNVTPFSSDRRPLTGASNIEAPLEEKVSCSRLINSGELVLRSAQTESLVIPSIMPSSPVATASTSVGPGNDVNIMSF